MKILKLEHALAEAVRNGKQRSTWRLFDDKDLRVDDRVVIVDKVDPDDETSWLEIGEAVIEKVIEKHLSAVGKDDYEGHEAYQSPEELVTVFRRYYNDSVNLDTVVKLISFRFYPYERMRLFGEQQTTAVPTAAVTVGKRVKLYTDGGSRGNPGPSASGYVIFNDQGTLVVDKGVYLGITTNNQAEYTALKLALEEAKKLQAQEVEVYMDSLLVVNQMKGIFKVKNRDLWPIHDAIKQLAKQFKHISFTHVPRELNKLADAAVNRALDEELGITSVDKS